MRCFGNFSWAAFVCALLSFGFAPALPVKVEQKSDEEKANLAAIACPVDVNPREGAFEIGAIYGAMFPSGYVGATTTLPTLGFVLGAPLFSNTLQLGINYGNSTEVEVTILEANIRWNFESPFLATYFITGAHYLNQKSNSANAVARGVAGLTGGFGLAFFLGKQMEAHIDLKGFVQERTTILVAGGFSILL
jgi:hypothetical protein